MNIDRAHSKIIAFAINQFGSGGHPMADPDQGLEFFEAPYVIKCLKKAEADKRISDAGKAACKAAIASISAA